MVSSGTYFKKLVGSEISLSKFGMRRVLAVLIKFVDGVHLFIELHIIQNVDVLLQVMCHKVKYGFQINFADK